MSASLADSTDRLPAWRMGIRGQAGSLLAKSGWQPDIRFSRAAQTDN